MRQENGICFLCDKRIMTLDRVCNNSICKPFLSKISQNIEKVKLNSMKIGDRNGIEVKLKTSKRKVFGSRVLIGRQFFKDVKKEAYSSKTRITPLIISTISKNLPYKYTDGNIKGLYNFLEKFAPKTLTSNNYSITAYIGTEKSVEMISFNCFKDVLVLLKAILSISTSIYEQDDDTDNINDHYYRINVYQMKVIRLKNIMAIFPTLNLTYNNPKKMLIIKDPLKFHPGLYLKPSKETYKRDLLNQFLGGLMVPSLKVAKYLAKCIPYLFNRSGCQLLATFSGSFFLNNGLNLFNNIFVSFCDFIGNISPLQFLETQFADLFEIYRNNATRSWLQDYIIESIDFISKSDMHDITQMKESKELCIRVANLYYFKITGNSGNFHITHSELSDIPDDKITSTGLNKKGISDIFVKKLIIDAEDDLNDIQFYILNTPDITLFDCDFEVYISNYDHRHHFNDIPGPRKYFITTVPNVVYTMLYRIFIDSR